MKINFKMSGGFAYVPALNKPIDIDTAQSDPQVAGQLESFVRDTRFFELSPQMGAAAKGAADYYTYTITVEDGDNIHTIQLTDPITDPNLHRFVSHLRNMARPSRS